MERSVTAERATAEQLAMTLREAITRLNRRVRQARPVGDLTFSQLSALTSLQLAGALTPRELADMERVQPPTMTKIVGKLEERGLVARTPAPHRRPPGHPGGDRAGPGGLRAVRAGAQRVAGRAAGRAQPRRNATRWHGPREILQQVARGLTALSLRSFRFVTRR